MCQQRVYHSLPEERVFELKSPTKDIKRIKGREVQSEEVSAKALWPEQVAGRLEEHEEGPCG